MTKAILTHQELTDLLHYDHHTGLFTWKMSRGSRAKIGGTAGTLNPDGYIQISLNKQIFKAHRLAWFYVHHQWPENLIDHINNIPNDNRLINLREASRKQNAENRGKGANNTSGFKGVHWHIQARKWRARIQHNGKHIHLGFFEKPELAFDAYKTAEKKLFTHRSDHE